MKRTLLTGLIVLCNIICSKAQNFPFGVVNRGELEMSKYKNDESANAVFLNEFGESKLALGESGQVILKYTYHARVKIFNEKGYAHGTIEIPLYNSDAIAQLEDVADEIKAVTIYKDDNGVIKTEPLDKIKIFDVRENKNHHTVKFAMPALRPGVIVEYTYRFVTPYFNDFHSWIFQSDIPKIHSHYETLIPGLWEYNVLLKGPQKLTKNTTDREAQCFTIRNANVDCVHATYEMDNIPAFVVEDYMTAPKNFMSAIYFELSEFTNPYSGQHVKVAKDWKDVDQQFRRDDYFGGQLKRKDLLKDNVAPVIAGLTSSLAKAKAVYSYVQKNIKWNNFTSIGSEGIRKALAKHTGNVADVNLLLVSALNAAGLDAEPVLLSTRDHGVVNKLIPVITEFNYIIAKVTIDDKTYLLDATDPLLSFGLLPLRCLNDKGRAMNFDKGSYWVDLVTDQHQNTTYSFNLTLQEDGKLKGSIINRSSGYAAYEKRKVIKSFNSTNEYVENLDEKLAKIKIISSTVSNVDSLDLPVVESYDVEIEAYNGLNSTRVNFNPYLFNRISVNPFKLEDRTYPVDWGMPSETKYVLNILLPDNYTVENEPKTESIALPNDGGKFVVISQSNGNSFSFSNTISFKKSIYTSDEYSSLKELYNKIILTEKAEMTFKKN